MAERYILLVEDSADDVALTNLAIRKAGKPVRMEVVWDGEQALEYVFARGSYQGRDPEDRPSVVLLDLNLPLVSGLEVLKQIRGDERTSKLPVVVFSTSTEEKDRSESRRLGADDYITKPPGLQQLIRVIRDIENKWLDTNGNGAGA